MATILPLGVPTTEEPLLHRRIEFLESNGHRASLPCVLFSLYYGPADATGMEKVVFSEFLDEVTILGQHLLPIFEGIADGTVNFVAQTGASQAMPWPDDGPRETPCIASITFCRKRTGGVSAN